MRPEKKEKLEERPLRLCGGGEGEDGPLGGPVRSERGGGPGALLLHVRPALPHRGRRRISPHTLSGIADR